MYGVRSSHRRGRCGSRQGKGAVRDDARLEVFVLLGVRVLRGGLPEPRGAVRGSRRVLLRDRLHRGYARQAPGDGDAVIRLIVLVLVFGAACDDNMVAPGPVPPPPAPRSPEAEPAAPMVPAISSLLGPGPSVGSIDRVAAGLPYKPPQGWPWPGRCPGQEELDDYLKMVSLGTGIGSGGFGLGAGLGTVGLRKGGPIKGRSGSGPESTVTPVPAGRPSGRARDQGDAVGGKQR